MGQATDNPYATDDLRWTALVQRDAQAGGAFLYGVKTTGVYCRPTCPSRLPNRRNVRFFSTSTDAERAGYRACKKCRPQTRQDSRPPDAVVRACQLIEAAEEMPSLAELAAAVGLSPFHFHRLFKAVLGITPKGYAQARRMERFQQGLQNGQPVTTALYSAGFGSSSRCYEKTADNLGMTPSQYRNGGAGQTIRFAVAECYLGWALVAATERGVCMIAFDDSPAVLRSELAARFPKAQLRADDPGLAAWVEPVLALLEAPGRHFDLPLDIQGTAFQRRVWQALQEIPLGTTATYAEVAQRIGSPTAVRAVARACAANPVAVVVPCHRVVGSDGALRGYRWGVERKRQLLRREAGE